MAFTLHLPHRIVQQGWKVKIRDKEGPEEPHVTILRKGNAWRISLRDSHFLDKKPAAREVPNDLMDIILRHLDQLRERWDQMYPDNRVSSSKLEHENG